MSKSKKKIQSPYWRPNFRIQSELPDIKVLRTGFIVNALAIAIFCSLAGFLWIRESKISSLTEAVSEKKERVEKLKPGDAVYLKKSKEFINQAKYIQDLENFYTFPFTLQYFLAELGKLKPDDLAFSQISMSESTTTLNKKGALEYQINVSGNVFSLSILTDFKETILESETLYFPGYSASVVESFSAPDASTKTYPFQISIVMNPVASGKKGEK